MGYRGSVYETCHYCDRPWFKTVPVEGGGTIQVCERHAYSPDGVTSPIRNAGPKPGRNQSCACGSGIKFKKCCGMKVDP